jgi:hypothetical protein
MDGVGILRGGDDEDENGDAAVAAGLDKGDCGDDLEWPLDVNVAEVGEVAFVRDIRSRMDDTTNVLEAAVLMLDNEMMSVTLSYHYCRNCSDDDDVH